jgi:peptide/nickel transport system permease protein
MSSSSTSASPATASVMTRLPTVLAGSKAYLGYLPAAVIVLIAIVGPWLVPFSATDVVGQPNVSPNETHLLGTDSSGLDVFSRVLAATRNDILIAVVTALISTVAGIAVGLVIGMNESRGGLIGFIARGLARGLDLLQAIPAVVIALALVAFFGTSILSMTIALAIILGPNQARLVRTEVLQVRTEAYLDAARMAGEPELALTIRHVLPNASWPALENATLVFGAAILLTATLGFLGVGLKPPTPEWGSMISTGASDAAVGRWWSALFPAVAIVIAVGAFAIAGQRAFGRR